MKNTTESKKNLRSENLGTLNAWLANEENRVQELIATPKGRESIETKIFEVLKKEEPMDKTANYNTNGEDNKKMKEVIHNIVLEVASKSETSTFKDKASAKVKYLINEITQFAKSIVVVELGLEKDDKQKLEQIKATLTKHTKSSSKKTSVNSKQVEGRKHSSGSLHM